MKKIYSLLMGLALGSFMLTLPGCACWTDQQKMNTPACVVARAVVDCTTDAAKTFGPDFVPIIVGLISGNPGSIDWSAIGAAAEQLGLKDGGCFIAEIKGELFSKPGAGSPQMLAAIRSAEDLLANFKQKHFNDTNVKFKVKVNGKEVLL